MTSFAIQQGRRPDRDLANPLAVPRYESLPVDPFIVAAIFFMCAPALGKIVPAVTILALGAILAIRWRTAGRMIATNWLFLALPVFAMLSAFWSEVPATSLRYGIQFALTLAIAIAIATTIPARRIALLVFIGVTAALVIGIASGRAGMSEAGPVLIGLAGSKNQMGFISLFWLIAALSVLVDRNRFLLLRLGAVPCVAAALFMIWQGDATTALVSAAAAIFLVLVFTVAGLLSRGGRMFCLFAGLLIGIGMIAAGPQMTAAAERFGTDVLHKDSTLTGRTLLWEYADTLIAEHPVLGHGYKAIWLGPDGVGLLERMGQTDGRAFNFHDTFRELEADLGYVGLAFFLIPLLIGGLKMGLLLLGRPTPARIFMVTVFMIVALRMRTELVLAPFLLDTVLLFMVLAYIWRDGIAPAPDASALAAHPRERPQRLDRRPVRSVHQLHRPKSPRRSQNRV